MKIRGFKASIFKPIKTFELYFVPLMYKCGSLGLVELAPGAFPAVHVLDHGGAVVDADSPTLTVQGDDLRCGRRFAQRKRHAHFGKVFAFELRPSRLKRKLLCRAVDRKSVV